MGPPLESFRLSPRTIQMLKKNDITHTTEVQAGTFDLLFEGKDIIAKSRTGTGKTLAFGLPIMERLAIIRKERGGPKPRGEGPGCIVLAPTRELAKQVSREMSHLGQGLGLSVECFYGGVGYGPQENALRRGVDVVVGTPGRIMDHLNKGNLRLDNISFAVLDEADEMLSMGFAQDVETIFETLPPENERQVILFSATVPRWVKNLASQFQKKDVVTFDAVTSGSMASTTVRHCAVRVPERDEARAGLLADVIAVHSQGRCEDTIKRGPSRAIVFTETKREADELATSGSLDGCGAAVLHGDVSQKQREVTLSQFRQGQFQVLVATDVAARGLDISGVDVVIQYRVPNDAESYIHRAGRTGRAGKSGTAVVMYSDRESRNLRNLERECRIRFDMEVAPAPETALEAAVNVALDNISGVDERVIKHLLPRAEEMLASGAEDTAEKLAAILAIAGRRTRLEDRSILSGEKGMRTVVVSGEREISPGLAMRFISDLARAAETESRVGLIRMCRDGSAVVDVISDAALGLVGASEKLGEDAEIKLRVASGVPQLKEIERRGGGRFDRRGGGGRSGGGGGRYDRNGGARRGSYRSDSRDSRGGGGGGGYGRRDGGGGGYQRRESGYGRRDGGYSGGRRDSGGYGGGQGGGGYSGGGGGGGYQGRGRNSGGARRSADFLSDDF
ncbi:DEAD (Asp-Glu-Ala-Asp) box polypeptide 21-like, putative [Chondrus crispus]|uniref:RNA helicase n=1 Tax=Chondrus crispus TaxID=2769 RepID=R7QI04_CHOCR|nr:DEAD (Asp-Glu-Ala-Asp) box polypeptide 21-like, putative [Chondrus crispus]CDF38147.1 DEAD (Asp-Glu-Ala-Asp) box polypeptide 21-like, putative [Chondrus crispus]|eukprot:XP_005718016.1 DEAD (Asp-Glu-Ala-Asp) box polypeptide 21-like, putative [Chondrus crispus]